MSICPYCRGSGVVAKGFHFPAHRCPDCRGGGKIVCPTCRAERDHYNDIHACAGCDIQVCSACGPDGYCKRCAEELAASAYQHMLDTIADDIDGEFCGEKVCAFRVSEFVRKWSPSNVGGEN